MSRLTGIMVLTFFMAGCSASGQRFQDSPFATQGVVDDKARIIFYREPDANFRSVTLSIDDSIVGSLTYGAFIVADIAPGDHRLSAWVRYTPIGKFATNINVSAGETYYIRASHRAERMLYPLLGPIGVAMVFADTQGEFQLEAVPATVALQALEELKLSE
jgi:Protein of unknown function (DUF2846)